MTLSNTDKPSRVGIAIVGMAFRFPGDLADDFSLWEALQQKKDLVTHVPGDRWSDQELVHAKRSEPGRSITFSAGVLSRLDEFDAEFFGISPREAAWLDPQQRLLLELSWEAMENAGVTPCALSGTDCAVYVGISSLDYGTRGLDDLAAMSSHSMTGNTLSIAANRLSYVFDLHGPSLAVDTACSSSLVALHHACRALQTGEASTALVGGVNLLLHPYPFVGFTKASMLSADGRCKVFDASGNGYVRAEGGAVFLLKPLAQALSDGDDIQAVILATGVNADGARKTGITIPSIEGQAELMRRVLAASGLSAQDIDFIEAHGTGTAVGDPIEVAAIGQVYGAGRRDPLPVGSIKANLGHMESASGMAGLVKVVLALKNRALPPQIHLHEPNPHIDFQGLNVRPVTESLELSKPGDKPLVAGVNSFGFGGANAHCLIQEYRQPPAQAEAAPSEPSAPLFLSARNEAALRTLADRYAKLIAGKEPQDYYDIAYAAAYRRERLDKRLAIVATTPAETVDALAAFAQGGAPDGVIVEDQPSEPGGVAFVYSGNGSQWLGMGLRLLDESPRFAHIMAELDAQIAPVAGFSVLAELRAEAASSRLDDTAVAQPLLFAMQIAITLLLREQGVAPLAVTGHSVGEVAAAWASGALDLAAAIRVIVARSRAQGTTRGAGRMAAVGLAAGAVTALLTELGLQQEVEIAGFNSPNNITLAGDLPALQRIQAHLEPQRVFFRLLDLDYAFHSRHMDSIRHPLQDSLTGLPAKATGEVTFVSTVTGEPLAGLCLDAHYWWRNVREPVRFADAVGALSTLGCRVFIEIGPHAILQRYIVDALAHRHLRGRALPSLRKGADGARALLEVALRAHLLSAKPTLDPYFPRRGKPVRLPNYPWQRERHWHPRTSESLLSIERRRVHPLLGWPIPGAEWTWENILDPVILPWLADHKVGGAIVYPGAAYVEMALAAAHAWQGGQRLVLEELDIVSPMVFDGEHARTLRLQLNPRDGSFQIKSRPRLSSDDWALHAAGRVLQPGTRAPAACIDAVATSAQRIEGPTHYTLTEQLGLDYGPRFRGLAQAWVDGERLEAVLSALGEEEKIKGYFIHPALLDVCYQSLVDFFRAEIEAGHGVALLPVKLGRLERYQHGVPSRFRARLLRRSARSVLADFELFDAQGQLIASVCACRFRAAPLRPKAQDSASCWSIVPWLRPHPTEENTVELPSSRELGAQIQSAWSELAEQRGVWFKETLPLFEALVLSFAYEACQTLVARQVDLQRLVASSSPLTRWILGLLRQEGLLHQDAEGRCLLSANADLPAAGEIWRTLQREHPESLPQLALMARIGSQLPQLLMSESDAASFVAGLRGSPVAEMLYEDDPAYAGTRRALEAVLHHLAAHLPAHRRLRVLELAAGASELPRVLLHALPEDRLHYVLALPDDALAERQRAECQHEPRLAVATLDPATWVLDADGPIPEHFDIVILRHVAHQAVSPHAALHSSRRWLAAGGLLVLAERYPDWSADFIAGVDPRWWHEPAHAEAAAAVPLSSLLPPSAWEATLAQQGFDEVRLYKEAVADGLDEGAYLLLAKRPRQDAPALPSPPAASWLLRVDEASAASAEALRCRLASLGQRVELAASLEAHRATTFDHVVYLKGWDATPETLSAWLAEVLADVQSLASLEGRPPRLWFVTRGGALATDLPASLVPNPGQTALWGFGRVVMNEHPDLRCTLIDLAGDPHAADLAARLENELLRPDGANEVVLTDAGRYTLVLREAQNASAEPARIAERFRLDFPWPGQLRNLVWVPQSEPVLGEHEVEVRVQATGLNFRDVMYLMGLLPDEAVEKGFAGASLGLEFSGIVTRVGARVRDLQAGDQVMGFGPACFASHVVTRADAVALMPDEWSFETAATVPTVFFTVYYALRHLADLQAGERVLIHGGAGGVGIAAIQLAKHVGAEVFATAGSEEKRDFVRLLGADHVFDSRSLEFAEDILAATQGQGVDVVLNSLAGEAIRRNLAVLKPFGRFLELGKRDFFENTPIGLRPFKDNISYFGIDADQLLTARPQLAARLFREVMALFREGVLTPLPCRVFSAERVVDAFRVMQQARHIGKVVVSLAQGRPAVQPQAAVPKPLQLSAEGTWLVSGGLSGFGLASARWLAAHGVRHLALVGRRGLQTPGAKDAVQALADQGVQVRAYACDIADAQAVAGLIEDIVKTLPPLRGVLHGAAIFDDALLQNLDGSRMEQVIAPKARGAWNLHQATLHIPLEHFVLYSSVTTAIGNPGQANYVAANAALEGLADMRRRMGLPALCIGWGPIGDAGYLARNETVRDSLAQRLGKPPLAAAQALDRLGQALAENRSITIAHFDWSTLARLLPSASSSRFGVLNRSLKHHAASADDIDFRALIAGKTPDEVASLVQQMVIQELAQILAISPERIEPSRSLHDLGLDSLMAVELALGLERRLGIQLPVMMLNESPSAEKVTQRIVEKLLGAADPESAPTPDAVVRSLATQHGEAVAAEEIAAIVEETRRLTQQGTRLTR